MDVVVNGLLVLVGAAVGASGFFYWGKVWERGHYDSPPCPRKHRDEL